MGSSSLETRNGNNGDVLAVTAVMAMYNNKDKIINWQ